MSGSVGVVGEHSERVFTKGPVGLTASGTFAARSLPPCERAGRVDLDTLARSSHCRSHDRAIHMRHAA